MIRKLHQKSWPIIAIFKEIGVNSKAIWEQIKEYKFTKNQESRVRNSNLNPVKDYYTKRVKLDTEFVLYKISTFLVVFDQTY